MHNPAPEHHRILSLVSLRRSTRSWHRIPTRTSNYTISSSIQIALSLCVSLSDDVGHRRCFGRSGPSEPSHGPPPPLLSSGFWAQILGCSAVSRGGFAGDRVAEERARPPSGGAGVGCRRWCARDLFRVFRRADLTLLVCQIRGRVGSVVFFGGGFWLGGLVLLEMSIFMSAVPPRDYQPPPVAPQPFAVVAPSNAQPDLLMPVLPPVPAPAPGMSEKKEAYSKRPWSATEDAQLLQIVKKLGVPTVRVDAGSRTEFPQWPDIAKYVPGRTAKQCRERWRHNLDPTIKREPWSEEENQKLLRTYDELWSKWADIARQLPGRTDNACVNSSLYPLSRPYELIHRPHLLPGARTSGISFQVRGRSAVMRAHAKSAAPTPTSWRSRPAQSRRHSWASRALRTTTLVVVPLRRGMLPRYCP
jgi:hypothetical protein